MSHPVTAVIFEGGAPTSMVELEMLGVRKAICLDNIEKLVRHPDYDRVILATNYPDLAAAALSLGAIVEDTTDWRPFHYGKALQKIVEQYQMEKVLYFSGASSPLLSYAEFGDIAQVLNENEQVVYVNNVQSADIVGWCPAKCLLTMEPPEMDNALGYQLRRQAHLPRLLMPHSSGIHFDLDTPTEILFLKLMPEISPRIRAAVDVLDWNTNTLEAAWDVLRQKEFIPSVWMSGRIGAPIIEHINTHLRARLRIISEERGMKAMNLEAEGKVCSFVAAFIQAAGCQAFFDWVSCYSDVAFIDTRVIFAHMKIKASEHDRFNSDLGNWQIIQDPFIREFTKAAAAAKIPIMLGGHTLILGGLWAMVDDIREKRAIQRGGKEE